MIKRFNHSDRPAPSTQFSEAAIVQAGSRMLITSGQVGIGPDGTLPALIEEQVENTWLNILRLLADAGTSADNIVKATSYLTNTDYIEAFRKIRNKHVPDLRACSTMVIVSALADPGFKVEVEIMAVVP